MRSREPLCATCRHPEGVHAHGRALPMLDTPCVLCGCMAWRPGPPLSRWEAVVAMLPLGIALVSLWVALLALALAVT